MLLIKGVSSNTHEKYPVGIAILSEHFLFCRV